MTSQGTQFGKSFHDATATMRNDATMHSQFGELFFTLAETMCDDVTKHLQLGESFLTLAAATRDPLSNVFFLLTLDRRDPDKHRTRDAKLHQRQ